MLEDRPPHPLPAVNWQQAAELIDEQRERLRVTLASIGDAVIATDDKGRIASMNGAAESLTGWAEDEAKGQPLDSVFRIINESTRQPVENPALRALREGVIVGLANHTLLIRKDGSERAIDDSASPIRDSHGHQIGAVLVFRDITERRRLEKENAERLAASRFLAAIVESSEDAIISKNLQGIIQSWNAAAGRMFGYTAREAIGQHISLIIPPDRIHEEDQIIDRMKAGERVEHFETLRKRRDGKLLDISLTISPMKDEVGQVIGASKIARDITEKKQAQTAIHKLNAELTAELESIAYLQDMSMRMLGAEDFPMLLEQALDAAIKITDADMGNIQLFQGQGLKIAAQRGFGEPFLSFFNNVQEERGACGTAMSKGERVVIEDVTKSSIFAEEAIREVMRTARVRAVQATPLISRSGRVLGMISTHFCAPHRPNDRQLRILDLLARQAADLIENKQAEEELRQKDIQLEKITENTSAMLTHCSRDLRYIFVNQAYANLVKKSREAIQGRPIVEIMGREGFEAIRTYVARVLRGEVVDYESLVPFEGVGPRFLHVRYVPDRDANGEVTGWFASVADITERKQAETRINDLMVELKVADKRKDEFLATLAHELRGPLAPLRSTLDILRQGDADPGLHQHSQATMDRQLSQLERLIDDLLDISRITRDKIVLRKGDVELASIIQQSVEACRPLYISAGHEMTVSLPPEPIYLHADPVRLAQVFGNILNNACKYTEPGGQIWLTAERQGSDVAVRIKDTGMGIPPDKIASVFEMFAQMDRSLDRAQGGLGIGLTLVKRLVEMHGGSVEAFSEGLGHGSEFVVHLPILIEKSPIPVPKPAPEPVIATPRRFLVVDDNKDAAISLAVLLRINGNETRMAHDGLDAVRAAESFQPDIILLDIGLPKLNGYDACRRIREQPWGKNMLIVAVTGWGQEEDRRKSHDAGFDFHMVKPVNYKTLISLLAEKQPAGATQPSV